MHLHEKLNPFLPKEQLNDERQISPRFRWWERRSQAMKQIVKSDLLFSEFCLRPANCVNPLGHGLPHGAKCSSQSLRFFDWNISHSALRHRFTDGNLSNTKGKIAWIASAILRPRDVFLPESDISFWNLDRWLQQENALVHSHGMSKSYSLSSTTRSGFYLHQHRRVSMRSASTHFRFRFRFRLCLRLGNAICFISWCQLVYRRKGD